MESAFDDEIGELLFQIHRLYHIRMSALVKALEISPRQIPILKHLYRSGVANQRQLAEKACVSPTAITLMLRKMEAKGLVEKKTDPADRRFFSVSLTEKGKSVVEQLKRLRKSIDGITVIGFTQEEQARLQSLLRTVRQNLLEQISANA